jgi:hypothetical protein
MNRKIIEYIVAVHGESYKLSREVEERIDEGYQPIGGIALAFFGKDQTMMVMQAMVKYDN